jgi:hypothetical protein
LSDGVNYYQGHSRGEGGAIKGVKGEQNRGSGIWNAGV